MTGRFALKHFCGGFLAGKMTTWSLNRVPKIFFFLRGSTGCARGLRLGEVYWEKSLGLKCVGKNTRKGNKDNMKMVVTSNYM